VSLLKVNNKLFIKSIYIFNWFCVITLFYAWPFWFKFHASVVHFIIVIVVSIFVLLYFSESENVQFSQKRLELYIMV